MSDSSRPGLLQRMLGADDRTGELERELERTERRRRTVTLELEKALEEIRKLAADRAELQHKLGGLLKRNRSLGSELELAKETALQAREEAQRMRPELAEAKAKHAETNAAQKKLRAAIDDAVAARDEAIAVTHWLGEATATHFARHFDDPALAWDAWVESSPERPAMSSAQLLLESGEPSWWTALETALGTKLGT